MNTLPQRLMHAVNGSFQKTSVLQKRVRELVRGAQPLFETREHNLIELIPDEDQVAPELEVETD